MFRRIVVALLVAFGFADVARAQNRGEVIWTISGGGVGFGVGLWAGLTAFDDAVDSDRKVWTSALVGAGVGAFAGYLIGRARNDRNRVSKTTNEMERGRRAIAERKLVEALPRSFRARLVTLGGFGRQAERRLHPRLERRAADRGLRRAVPGHVVVAYHVFDLDVTDGSYP